MELIEIAVARGAVEDKQTLERYRVPLETGGTVLGALLYVYEHYDSSLAFGHGCRNKDCGLCAVDVNGKPRLACTASLKRGMVVRPLPKLPLARDLLVDRKWIMRYLRDFDLFTPPADPARWPRRLEIPPQQESLLSCNECLSCLAACPSFEFGVEARSGPYHFVKLAQLHWDQRDDVDRKLQATRLGIARCSQCRRCACPQGIPIYKAAVSVLALR